MALYRIGDFVVYGRTGVCKITDITAIKSKSGGEDQHYYVLSPLFGGSLTIYAPVDTKVSIRSAISAAEAERLIDTIPKINATAYYSERMQELTQHYESYLKDSNCADLMGLAMSIYAKKREIEQQNRKFGQVDDKYLKQAEELLYGEFSLALGISKDKVPEYIASRVDAIEAKSSNS
jgi:CarD family transcriptional regulator